MGRGRTFFAALAAAWAPVPAIAQEAPALGPNLERFAYPFPLHWFEAEAQGVRVRMAYLDLLPDRPNGRTVVLLHGKNFCAATWEETMRALAGAGYRVIAPDQVGFCKSSKPAGFQYSLHALAALTTALIKQAGVAKATVVGHSMGGMLATRLALMHPEAVEQLVLVNPLGVADWQAEGIPYAPIAALRAEEDKASAATIKAYQLDNYYHGEWRPEYDRWVAMLAGMYAGEGRPVVAEAQARTSDMIQTQPVAYEFARLAMPTVLIIGTADRTVFGKARAPAAIRDTLRPIPAIAPEVAKRIPQGRLVTLDGLGHAPQVEAPARFQATLLEVLAAGR